MAFVYRTVDKQNPCKSQLPGPGAYFKPRKNLQSHEIQHRVPFNHSQNREIWKTSIAPGPGAYESENLLKKQKKLLSNLVGDFAVYEAPSESVAFKSKTIRFSSNTNANNPGPGEYDTESQSIKPVSASKKSRMLSSQLKQFLKQKNYMLKGDDEENNHLKDIIVTPKDDYFPESFLEPKISEIQVKKESKNSIFFASKVQRDINRTRPQTSAGPGSYNIAKSTFEIEKKYTKKSPVRSICIDKRVQKIQIEEVGPGYYEIDQAFKNLNQSNLVKKKKIQCFGSTVDRFQIFKTDAYDLNPGPASYSLVNQSIKKVKKSKTPGTSFPKEDRKIFQPPKNTIIPISYNAVQDFCSATKQKYQRKPSSKECFGSTKQRFQQKAPKIQTSNAQTSNVNLIVSQPRQNATEKNKLKQAKFYRTLLQARQRRKRFEENVSVSQPKLQINTQVDRPLCYDNEAFTLSSKYGHKTQKNAPFMSGAERFKDFSEPQIINLDSIDGKKQNKGNAQKSQKQRLSSRISKRRDNDGKVGWIAVNKDERFKYTTNIQVIGPQYYDPVLPLKRSYNVLFSQNK